MFNAQNNDYYGYTIKDLRIFTGNYIRIDDPSTDCLVEVGGLFKYCLMA